MNRLGFPLTNVTCPTQRRVSRGVCGTRSSSAAAFVLLLVALVFAGSSQASPPSREAAGLLAGESDATASPPLLTQGDIPVYPTSLNPHVHAVHEAQYRLSVGQRAAQGSLYESCRSLGVLRAIHGLRMASFEPFLERLWQEHLYRLQNCVMAPNISREELRRIRRLSASLGHGWSGLERLHRTLLVRSSELALAAGDHLSVFSHTDRLLEASPDTLHYQLLRAQAREQRLRALSSSEYLVPEEGLTALQDLRELGSGDEAMTLAARITEAVRRSPDTLHLRQLEEFNAALEEWADAEQTEAAKRLAGEHFYLYARRWSQEVSPLSSPHEFRLLLQAVRKAEEYGISDRDNLRMHLYVLEFLPLGIPGLIAILFALYSILRTLRRHHTRVRWYAHLARRSENKRESTEAALWWIRVLNLLRSEVTPSPEMDELHIEALQKLVHWSLDRDDPIQAADYMEQLLEHPSRLWPVDTQHLADTVGIVLPETNS